MVIRSTGEKVFSVFNYILMSFICVITIYPLWHVAMSSVSDPMLLLSKRGFYFWPVGRWTLRGYELVLGNPNIPMGFRNTAFYVTVGTAMCMFVTILGAYVLSRKGLFWNKPVMLMIVFTMYFQGGLIPFYLQVKNMNLLDNRWSVILPILVQTWNLIILRTAFSQVTDSIIESAKIDGASDWRVVWQIVVPVAKATVAVVALWYAVRFWNEWFNPSLFIKSKSNYPLQLLMREILLKNENNDMIQVSAVGQTGKENYRRLVKYCTIIVGTVPILLVYPFVQKYFVHGIMIGSVKG